MKDYGAAGDNELMQWIAQADKEAFSALMRRYLPAVLAFNRQYVPQYAEDIAQESFIRLWSKAPQWQEKGISPKAWLLRVSYNQCIDQLRKNQPVELDEHVPAQADATASVERLIQAESDLLQQRKALQHLPERQRSAIVLTACSGLSNKDAAAALGISIDALESLLARGRHTLKMLFEQATGYSGGEINHDDT